ncbi:MAG TPA: hypothetical protein VFP16_11840, partial [Vicinamibacterales bacterium]|nr:hypothetical protein [Vicinamibacterales bacterium]
RGGGRYRPPRGRRSAPITKMTAPAAASTIFQASIPRNVAPLALTARAAATMRPASALCIGHQHT